MNKKLIAILGSTGSGKTELSIKLAKKFNGEIVSADSRQVYKEMDIGTAKPLRNKQLIVNSEQYIVGGIPHYLIDVVRPDEEFNVAIYKKLAVKAIKDIQKREKLAFLAGGTGLYVWAVVNNLKFPKMAPQKKLRKELEKKSPEQLFKIYKKLDPKGTKHIDKENKRRLVRAIEVCKVTGKGFWKQRKKEKPLFDVLQIGIKMEREELKQRIKKRTNEMFEMGLEKEAKKLFKKYGQIPSLQTIGYQEWIPFFGGKATKKEVKEKIATHTIQYAKRQITWFKRDKRIFWIKNYQQAEKLVRKFLER